MKFLIGLSLVALIFAAGIWWLYPRAIPIIAAPILTADEINACAVYPVNAQRS